MTVTEAALRADPNFRRYLGARVVSAAGTLLIAVVLPVLVYRVTGSLTWTSAAVVASALPHLLLGVPAVALADRWDRRRILVGADLGRAAALLSVPAVWLAGGGAAIAAWHLLAVVFVLQALHVLADAADAGALPVLVGEAATDAGSSAVTSATTLAALMVPPLAGLAVTVAPAEPLLAMGAATVVASALLVRAVRRPLSAKGTFVSTVRQDLRVGFQTLFSVPTARVLTITGTAHAAVGGAWFAILLPWADVVLGVPPAGDARLALLLSTWAIGALVAGCLTPMLRRRVGAGRLTAQAMLASLAGGLGVLACTHWLPAVLVSTLWATAYWVVAFTVVAQRRSLAPEPLRSRVDACGRLVVRGLGYPLGAGLAAGAGTLTSPRGGFAAALVVLVVGVAVAWRPLRAAEGS